MTSIPIFSFVAWSGTGKTTFLEQVIPHLKAAGLRVAVVKHDGHDFEIDKEGKDSWRMRQAGADVTAVVSAEKAAVMFWQPVDMETILDKIHDVDIIITEGYKVGPWRKIALRRKENGKPYPFSPETCFAIVSDDAADDTGAAPWFDLADAEGVAKLLIKTIGS